MNQSLVQKVQEWTAQKITGWAEFVSSLAANHTAYAAAGEGMEEWTIEIDDDPFIFTRSPRSQGYEIVANSSVLALANHFLLLGFEGEKDKIVSLLSINQAGDGVTAKVLVDKIPTTINKLSPEELNVLFDNEGISKQDVLDSIGASDAAMARVLKALIEENKFSDKLKKTVLSHEIFK